jgi:predicted PurR-regulated permease PerM
MFDMNTTAAVVLLAATILGANGLLFFDSAQLQLEELNNQFSNIRNQTTSFLDHAWDTAQKFQDPHYNYDPSELGNYTAPELSATPNAADP